ncbi:hypothetical protein PPYR_00374 [Photinus pyralis]|uniref:Uncharacterized protein n=1 Tax=Photinus pyralis TaxID=7054 RepID=A0A1Y1KJI0_PHOPY|nr:uncharacterized protein LOC116171403 [Photinus pyralis]KAB0803404.1 hypothetical protein PPYR_00374 [Photinus pyralis]
MHSVKLFFLLLSAEVFSKGRSTKENGNNTEPIDALKAALIAHKKECASSNDPPPIDRKVEVKNTKNSGSKEYPTHPRVESGRHPYRDYNYEHDYVGQRGGYELDPYPTRVGYNPGYIRLKRNNDEADYDDDQCLIQCLFEYLEVLDENQSPSEFALIKWFQENTPQNEKRIKAIREIRRCFGHTAATDDGDGCDYSKSLLKCLNLEIEE